jgi:hypothetical protein
LTDEGICLFDVEHLVVLVGAEDYTFRADALALAAKAEVLKRFVMFRAYALRRLGKPICICLLGYLLKRDLQELIVAVWVKHGCHTADVAVYRMDLIVRPCSLPS